MVEEGISIKSPERREKESFGDLTIFTTTFYKGDDISKIRAELAVGFFTNVQQLGINLIVVDGGSNQDFLKKLSGFNNVTIVKEDPSWGMGGSRREALKRAVSEHHTDFYLWTEPEKTNFITKDCLELMMNPLRTGVADIVMPKRKEGSMAGLPKIQRWFEERANRRATRIMYGIDPDKTNEIRKGQGEEIDFWFGPKLFNQKGIKFFLDYQAKGLDKWDAVTVPVIKAYKAGLKIASIEIDYTYDERQKTTEEGDRAMEQKRLVQYRGILKEMDDPFWVHKIKKQSLSP